ncbi:MAG: hypothetical protein HY858_11290 [Candidatus Solibacter usitatus]|nr:hypothetical protein [Candidatus Solibacter usitatus]
MTLLLLWRASLAYFALPVFIFLAAWLRWYLAIPVCAALLTAIFNISVHQRPSAAVKTPFLALLLASVLVFISGTGGFGRQSEDHPKHNAVLLDLIDGHWPVYYESGAQPAPMTYYAAYYLPAALVGKLLGWQAANLFLALWTALGMALALLLFQSLSRTTLAASALFVLLWSGMRDIGGLLARDASAPSIYALQYWSHIWNAPGGPLDLHYIPQHAIAGWLAALLLLGAVKLELKPSAGALILALCLPWSTLVAVGLAPFVALQAWRARGTLLKDPAWALAAIPAAAAALFLVSSAGALPAGPISHFLDWRATWPVYLVFLLVEWAILALLLWPFSELLPRGWLTLSIALLTLLPLYRVGLFYDLTAHAARPALAVLLVGFAWRLSEHAPPLPYIRRALAVLCIIVGSFESVRFFTWSAVHYRLSLPPASEVRRLPQHSAGPQYNAQYLGRPQAAFFRFLAAPPVSPLSLKTTSLDYLSTREQLHDNHQGLGFIEGPPGSPVRWAFGPDATLCLLEPHPHPALLDFHFDLRPGQTVTVLLNGRALRSYSASTSDSIDLDLPAGPSTITFRSSTWNSPADPFAPADSRPLAFLFHRLRVTAP